MRLYFDTPYVGKCYWNEPDGKLVRELARGAEGLYSSAICIAEMACLAHRKVREGPTTSAAVAMKRDLFLDDVNTGVITALPVTDRLLRRVEAVTRALPPSCFLRTFDALHLVTAADSGFVEIWTNDRHMLAAAPHFGLAGRSVGQ
ncbi:MAG: PIN domain-containing protein [Bryobacterales bacterium]|nr:PIN domain-containing protein [Bryobacterales bacterium]